MTPVTPLAGLAVPLLFNLLTVGLAVWLGLMVAFRVAPSAAPRLRYAVAVMAFAAASLLPLLQTTRDRGEAGTRLPSRGQAALGEPSRTSGPRLPVRHGRLVDGLNHVARRATESRTAQAFTGLWLLVAAVLLAREVLAHVAVARAIRSLRPAPESVRARLAWPDQVPLFLEEGCDPRTIGLLRPAVVLPPRLLAELSPEAAAGLARHELAHVRRHDPFVNAAVRTVRAMLWPSLPLWLLEEAARAEREAAADDDAIAGPPPATPAGLSAVHYAETLLVVAEWAWRPRAWGAAASGLGRGPALERRIRRLVDRQVPTSPGRLALAASVVAAALALAALVPAAAEVLDAASALEDHRVALERRTTDALRRAGWPRSAAEEEAARMVAGTVRLMRALPARDWRLEGEVEAALAEVRSKDTLEPVATALEDGEPGVRERCAWALGQIGDRRAVPLLVVRLHDSSPLVRETAAWALGQIRDPAATSAIVATLEDDSPGARQAAAWALGRLGAAGAVEPLIRRLGDPAADVRHGALWALGVIGDGRAAEAVRALREDPSTDVRRAAAAALRDLEGS